MTSEGKQTARKPGRHEFTGAGPGRPKGSKNKATLMREGLVRQLLTSLDDRGGVEYLKGLNDRDFVSLLKQIIPRNIELAATLTIDDMIREWGAGAEGGG